MAQGWRPQSHDRLWLQVLELRLVPYKRTSPALVSPCSRHCDCPLFKETTAASKRSCGSQFSLTLMRKTQTRYDTRAHNPPLHHCGSSEVTNGFPASTRQRPVAESKAGLGAETGTRRADRLLPRPEAPKTHKEKSANASHVCVHVEDESACASVHGRMQHRIIGTPGCRVTCVWLPRCANIHVEADQSVLASVPSHM